VYYRREEMDAGEIQKEGRGCRKNIKRRGMRGKNIQEESKRQGNMKRGEDARGI
jgi:hypothetical protein